MLNSRWVRGAVVAASMVFAIGYAAQAATLYQEDFSKETSIKGYNGQWVDGGQSGSGAGKGSFHIGQDGWLDPGDGDSPTADLVRWITGDANWTNVAVASHIRVNGQNTGWFGIVARFKDVNDFYLLRYTTGNAQQLLTGDQATAGSPDLQIDKMVGGTLSVLAEKSGTDNGVPAINANGDQNAAGAVFQLVVDGSTLKALVNGKVLLSATDSSLKAGKVGFVEQEYYPLFQNITVTTP